jgi:peptide/nickel transport system substrate-binding protein
MRLGRRAVIAAPLLAPAVARGQSRVLKFVPHTSLSSLDALWSGTLISYHHGFMVHDQLYALDASLTPRPQMVQGHEQSDDRLSWRFILRDGLWFHDGEPVRAADCVATIIRWSKRDLFGQRLAAQWQEIRALDDRRFEIRLKKPFPHMLLALTSSTCLIMPARLANPDITQQVKEAIGSGPYRFLPGEWDSGSHVAYARFDRYQPRSEPPSLTSGGKVAHMDRVEWHILPDPATAAAALLKGEVDWLERPLPDVLPQLKQDRSVIVETLDPLGWVGTITFNQKRPPFDNPKLRRAIWPALDQRDFVGAVVGDDPALSSTGVGFFTPGTPSASARGLDVLTSPRNLELARKLVRESGYGGENIVHMVAGDIPANVAMGQVTTELFRQIGLNVTYASMDWGVLISRVRNPDPSEANAWHSYCTGWTGLSTSNPGASYPLAGNKPNPRMDALRADWFDSEDASQQKTLCEQMQLVAFEEPPFLPIGQWFFPHAHRKSLAGLVPSPMSLFWNVHWT